MYQIWIIVDENNKIKHCWEAPDPTNPKNSEQPPITINPMPPNWKIIKIKEPELLGQFQEEAQNKRKTLSRFILEECEVDHKSRLKRPDGLSPDIEYKEIRKSRR